MSNVAFIIWQQINPSTKMACGAKNPVSADKGLYFDVTIKRGQSNKIEIILEENDTYIVKLHYFRGTKHKIVKEYNGIYADLLSQIVYDFCNK